MGCCRARSTSNCRLIATRPDTLGLPPDLPVELDDSLIQQFQLVSSEATALQASIIELQGRIGRLGRAPTVADLEEVFRNGLPLIGPLKLQLGAVRNDLDRMDQIMMTRKRSMTNVELAEFEIARDSLLKSLADRESELDDATVRLNTIARELAPTTTTATATKLNDWNQNISALVERSVLIQARARLEMVTVEVIDLDSSSAVDIALENRLDFMNGRAALVDSWRQIQFNADALQSVIDVTASGEMRTARNNPVSFRAPTGNLRMGLEFDAPLTRLLERNAYRETLINYQRDRRQFIQSRDSLSLGLRALLRQIEQLRASLEIQRGAVAIAITRVDLTQNLAR